MTARDDAHIATLLYAKVVERQMADIAKLRAANERLGSWMSAALDDPGVCAEMKADIAAWFEETR